MTYQKCELTRRIIPIVTFVLISVLLSGKLICARPQETSFSTSQSNRNDIIEKMPEKVESDIVKENDRNSQSNINAAPVEPVLSYGATEKPNDEQSSKIDGVLNVGSGLDFGRAAAEASTKSTPIVNTLKSITKPIFPGSVTDMIITDIRTPPKIKSQIAHSQMQSLHTPGKGEVIPVVLDGNDEAALEKISSDNFKYTHSDATPSSGLSTWILLNADTVSTPFSHHKKIQKPPAIIDAANATTDNTTENKRKPPKMPTTTTTTTEKIIKTKIDAIIIKKNERKPIATIQKVNQTHIKKPPAKIDPEENLQITTNASLQDSKFKNNKTPFIVGKVPVTTKESANATTTPMSFIESPPENNTRLGTPVVTFPHVPVRQKLSGTVPTRKPTFVSSVKPTVQAISNLTPLRSDPEFTITSTLSIVNQENVITEEITSEPSVEITTTRKSQSTITKKKKKNKNKTKRRRPSKKPAAKVQSKISEDDNSTSKLPGIPMNRPLSTRIYNYLAREVMPNVGVGIVGIMLTAGLAGLLLYPFGGAVPIRRNYEKPNPSYNLNDYPPVNEIDNGQPEESVLSQVLAGMSNTINQYSREQPDVMYKMVPKYKPARFDNTNAYNAQKEVKYSTEGVAEEKFSELGDVVSGPHESVKFTNFDINDSIKYPMESSQRDPSYSTIDLTSSVQKEPVPYHKYNPLNETPIKHESSYSTLGEYASYNNPNEPIQNPVYNGDIYDYKNHKNEDTQEFKVSSELEVVTQPLGNQTTTTTTTKSPKHEPSFAALEGIPKNYRTLQTSIRFEDNAASVLPMNQEFVPSDGIYTASMEHGPRNMKIRRKKRNTSNENELDSVILDGEKTTESSNPPVQFITTDSIEKNTYSTQSNNEYNENITEYFTTKTEKHSTTPITVKVAAEDGVKILNANINQNHTTNNDTFFVMPEQNPTVSETNFTYFESITKPKDDKNINDTNLNNEIEQNPSNPGFSLSTFFKNILNFKLKIGFEILRATSGIITKYLGTVQQRMVETLRDIQKSAMRMNTVSTDISKVIKKRQKMYLMNGS